MKIFTILFTDAMKIAIFSDVHGNLPALEAVLSAIGKYRPDKIYCLGDLVNFAPFTNEVIDMIRERNIPTIMGNHDDGIGNRKYLFPFSGTSPAELSAGQQAIACTNDTITELNRSYLKKLPPYIHIGPMESAGCIEMLLTHGSPRNNDEYINEDYDEQELLRMMDIYHADLMFAGHTHQAYQRLVRCDQYQMERMKRMINVGSVGRPTDGDWRAAYCTLELDAHSNLFDKNSIRIKIVRVEYDIQRTIEAILSSDIPDVYAQTLIKAGNK